MLDGRIMGLDVGDKTIGVAVSDLMGLTAQGVKTIKRVGKKKDIEALKEIIKERQVNKIVSGLPKNMNNTYGEATQRTMEFKTLLEKNITTKIVLQDERLTTVQADNYMIEAGMSRKKRKKKIDSLAANIILQTYLDSIRGGNYGK